MPPEEANSSALDVGSNNENASCSSPTLQASIQLPNIKGVLPAGML